MVSDSVCDSVCAVPSLLPQVIATHGPSLTPAALDAMSYADAVIREVLRITPPSASVFRKTMVDLEVRRCHCRGSRHCCSLQTESLVVKLVNQQLQDV